MTTRLPALVAVVAACAADPGADGLTLELATPAAYAEARLEERVLAPFARAHPGVRVVHQGAGAGSTEYRERLLTEMAAGAPPDVFRLDDRDVPAFSRRGALRDLAPSLRRLGVDLSRYHPAVLGVFRRGDTVYALPTGFTPLLVAYNKDLFDRAGVPYPSDDWTWDDFLQAATQLTRDTDGDGRVDQWGTSFDRRAFFWIPWIWSGGGDVLCAGGRRASGCLDAPATVAALDWYAGWVTRDSVVPRARGPRGAPGDQARLFYAGRVAMLTAGHFWVPSLLRYVREGRLHVGFSLIPHRRGSPAATVIYTSGYAVPADAPQRRMSVELVSFLADSGAQALRAARGLELPSLAGVAQAVAAQDTLGWERAFLRAARVARPSWGARVEEWGEIEVALADMMDRITLGGVDAKAAARETAARVDRLLERRAP